jgi:hypothetical protein
MKNEKLFYIKFSKFYIDIYTEPELIMRLIEKRSLVGHSNLYILNYFNKDVYSNKRWKIYSRNSFYRSFIYS